MIIEISCIFGITIFLIQKICQFKKTKKNRQNISPLLLPPPILKPSLRYGVLFSLRTSS